VRATTLLNDVLDLPGVDVRGVWLASPDRMVVQVALRRRRLCCPVCGASVRARYDRRPVSSRWRHLDVGARRIEVHAELRRLCCPIHGVRTEAVPFARPGAGFTGDFEDLVAWLATKMDKSAICRYARIDWDSVGRICERVVADGLDTGRFDGLVAIGVDEVSWRKNHHYLTLVCDHAAGKVIWGQPGRHAKTLDAFFAELGTERAGALEAVSSDMGPAFLNSIKAKAPDATRCIDPFHVVKLATDALNKVRRATWQQMRTLDPAKAKTFKGARWALLKNPTDLNNEQQATLRRLKRHGGELWRAYRLKESLRAVFAGDLNLDEVTHLLDRWTSQAQRCRLAPFVTAAKTVRKHRDGILAAIRLGINNGRAEGINNVVRLIVRRAFGFHSPQAALALVMLARGPITLLLPHERGP
jgi:transposase